MDRCSWEVLFQVYFLESMLMVFSYFGIEKIILKGEKLFKIAVKAFDGIWGILTILIVVVGYSCGVFTATESAAIACVYSIIVVLFIYKICFYKRRFGVFEGV